jgi:hypothetical protein
VDALAAGLKRAGRVRRWRELQVEFETIPEVPANLQAASMTGFIMREHGIRGVRDAWDGESAFTDLEPRWTAHLAAVQPAELDLERLKREGC